MKHVIVILLAAFVFLSGCAQSQEGEKSAGESTGTGAANFGNMTGTETVNMGVEFLDSAEYAQDLSELEAEIEEADAEA